MQFFVSSGGLEAYCVVKRGVGTLSKQLSTERLAKTIKARREELGLTQAALADLTGIHRVTIGRIERENFIPSVQQLEALSDALKFDLTDMFTDVPENDSFIALCSRSGTDKEQEGIDKLFAMMFSLRQQFLLRRKFEDARIESP